MKIKSLAGLRGLALPPRCVNPFSHLCRLSRRAPRLAGNDQNTLLLALSGGSQRAGGAEQSCTRPVLSSVALFSTLAAPEKALVTSLKSRGSSCTGLQKCRGWGPVPMMEQASLGILMRA